MRSIEITDFQPEGYKPLVDYDKWRVAVLRFCDDLRPENLRTMQKHNGSDEVFVLLRGEFTLFAGGSGDAPGEVEAVELEPMKIYNVKRGVWHTHTLSKDAAVLIVENRDTCDENSPKADLSEDQRQAVLAACGRFL